MAKAKIDVEMEQLAGMQLTYDLETSGARKNSMGALINIDDIVGEIEPGMRRFGFTAGQYSFSDLIDYILHQTGPADLYLSTWAASNDGVKKIFNFLENEMLRSVKFMIDAGAKKYRDEQFGKLLDRFGECIRTTRIHAKFAVIRNENWNIVIRTSANLNRNLRLENWEIDDDEGFADFFQSFFDEAFKQIPVDDNHTLKSSQKLKDILDVAGGQSDQGVDHDIDDIFNRLTK